VLIITMSCGRIRGRALSRSSAVITSHLPFGIDTATPVPKKRQSG